MLTTTRGGFAFLAIALSLSATAACATERAAEGVPTEEIAGSTDAGPDSATVTIADAGPSSSDASIPTKTDAAVTCAPYDAPDANAVAPHRSPSDIATAYEDALRRCDDETPGGWCGGRVIAFDSAGCVSAVTVQPGSDDLPVSYAACVIKALQKHCSACVRNDKRGEYMSCTN